MLFVCVSTKEFSETDCVSIIFSLLFQQLHAKKIENLKNYKKKVVKFCTCQIGLKSEHERQGKTCGHNKSWPSIFIDKLIVTSRVIRVPDFKVSASSDKFSILLFIEPV